MTEQTKETNEHCTSKSSCSQNRQKVVQKHLEIVKISIFCITIYRSFYMQTIHLCDSNFWVPKKIYMLDKNSSHPTSLRIGYLLKKRLGSYIKDVFHVNSIICFIEDIFLAHKVGEHYVTFFSCWYFSFPCNEQMWTTVWSSHNCIMQPECLIRFNTQNICGAVSRPKTYNM